MESDASATLNYEEWQGDCKFWQHAVCGSAAGVMEHLALFPLDTMKTRLQCGWYHCRKLASTPALDSSCLATSAKPKSQLYQNLFRGCGVIAVGCIPAHVMYFSVYEAMKKTNSVGLAGAMATLCHDVILTPADVIKQRLQLGTYKSPLKCIYHVIRNEGFRSLYRSLSVTLFMNVPYHALLVTVNEGLIRMFPAREGRSSIYGYFLYAGIGGAIAGALTNPIDVIKTRLQTQECHMNGPSPCKPIYKNPIEAVTMVYRKEGFRGFWKGTGTRVGICVPAAAICWGTYATLKSLMVRFNHS